MHIARIASNTPLRASLSVLLCAVLALGTSTAWASNTTKKSAKPAASSTKSSTKSSKAKTPKSKARIPVPMSQSAQDAAEASATDRELNEQEQKFAKWVDEGTFACDEGGAVTLTAQSGKPGYFLLTNRGQHYRVSPRVSITGAVRLESNAGGIVWLQLANKSMLIAPKQSRRLADGCMSESQKVIAAEMLRNPSPSLFDSGKAQPSAPAVAAAAPAATAAEKDAKNSAMPVLRLVEVPPAVVSELPSRRTEQEAAAIMGGQ
ncbi:MAG: hypothetical protein ACH34Y_08335 [Brachymonas sp.]